MKLWFHRHENAFIVPIKPEVGFFISWLCQSIKSKESLRKYQDDRQTATHLGQKKRSEEFSLV